MPFSQAEQVQPKTMEFKTTAAYGPLLAVVEKAASELETNPKWQHDLKELESHVKLHLQTPWDDTFKSLQAIDHFATNKDPETQAETQELVEAMAERAATSSRLFAEKFKYFLTKPDAKYEGSNSANSDAGTGIAAGGSHSSKVELMPAQGHQSRNQLSTPPKGENANDEIIDKSIRQLAGTVVGFRKLHQASCRIAVESVEVGYVPFGNEQIPAYRMTLACTFGSYDDCIIDEALVKVRFHTTDTSNEALDPEAQPRRHSHFTTWKTTSREKVNEVPGAPKIITIAPREHYGKTDISTTAQKWDLSPHIEAGGVDAEFGSFEEQRNVLERSRWSVKGAVGQDVSCDDTVWWRVKANPARLEGVPQALRFVALVAHNGGFHAPVTAEVKVKWALRTEMPGFVRGLFGWESRLVGTFHVASDGDTSKLDVFSRDPGPLDELVKDNWTFETLSPVEDVPVPSKGLWTAQPLHKKGYQDDQHNQHDQVDQPDPPDQHDQHDQPDQPDQHNQHLQQPQHPQTQHPQTQLFPHRPPSAPQHPSLPIHRKPLPAPSPLHPSRAVQTPQHPAHLTPQPTSQPRPPHNALLGERNLHLPPLPDFEHLDLKSSHEA